MDEKQNEILPDIMENSDGTEKRIGDFVIRHDYGANVYYEGSGGDVEIPEEAGELGFIIKKFLTCSIQRFHHRKLKIG